MEYFSEYFYHKMIFENSASVLIFFMNLLKEILWQLNEINK